MRRSVQGPLPILFSIGFVVVIVGLGARRLAGWPATPRAFGVVLLGLYLAWLAGESRVASREIEKRETRLDRGTMEIYAAGRLATVVAALAVLAPPPPIAALGTGLAVFVLGVVLRLVAVVTLGKHYSHRVRVESDHAVVDRGPYRFVRHPAYAGMLIAHLGIAVFFWSAPALLVLALVLLPGIVLRIRVEERALAALPGYDEYSRGRARLLPRVW
jgi:protein-S-isoprenylcysteine O-methyltransferase Ste14